MHSNTQTSPRAWLAGLSLWTILTPLIAGVVLGAAAFGLGSGALVAGMIALALAGSVFAAVHHAEVVAHRVGEPYGTLLLALAVTLIEVALIVGEPAALPGHLHAATGLNANATTTAAISSANATA